MKYTGTGTRVLNFLIDNVIIFILVFIVFRIYNFYVFNWRYPAIRFGWFYLAITFIYYFLFEIFTRRTPGKYFSHSIVVDEHNHRPSVLRILIRSLVRLTIIDMFFIPFFNKPLHDKLSKTELVEL